MKTLPLRYRGKKPGAPFAAIVDDEDHEFVCAFAWRVLHHGIRVYALRVSDGARMHRLVWERAHGPIPPGQEIDHREPGGLDNRKANLRLATKQLNQGNARAKGSISGFKGVHRNGRRWRAQIMVDRKQQHLGYFDEPAHAARAYDAAAVAAFGEFARVNFP